MRYASLNKIFATSIAVATALSAASCSGRKIARDQVDSIKSVALVGFSVEQRMPNTAVGVLETAFEKKDNSRFRGLKPAPIAEPSEHARKMYDDLQKELAQGMRWKVLARQDLTLQPEYAQLFAKATKQPQLRPMVSGGNISMFVPDGIVETFLLNSMSMDERRELIRKLGVDAVAVVTVRVELINEGGMEKLVGSGELHPKAKVGFKLYNATSEDPIWMDLNADGEEGEGSKHSLGIVANEDKLNKQVLLTTDSAFHALVSHYHEN